MMSKFYFSLYAWRRKYSRALSVNVVKAITVPSRAKNIAIINSTGESYTYDDIRHAASQLASKFKETLPRKETRTIACLDRGSINYVITTLAAWAVGASVVPLSASHSPRELSYFISDSSADMIAFSSELKELLPCDLTIPQLELPAKLNINTSTDLESFTQVCSSLDENSTALIVYTSGTTGKPKGVIHSHAGLYHMVESLSRAWEYSAQDKILHFLPLHHMHGIVNKLWCVLYAGGTVEFMPSADAKGIWNHLASLENKSASLSSKPLSLFMAVPTVYAKMIQCVNDKVIDPVTLQMALRHMRGMRVMISGSAALPTPILHSWKALTGHQLLERYGMTEVGMALSNPLHGTRREGFVGRPFPFVECRIVADEDDSEGGDGTCGAIAGGGKGVSGELRIKGPTVFNGYLNRPEETAAAFDSEGWFRTGDVAERVLVDGEEEYRILGRSSTDIIKSAGYKISALEIERELLAWPKVLEVAVVGVSDPTYGEVIAAVIVMNSKTTAPAITVEYMRNFLQKRLAVYKHPRILRLVNEIPKNQLGKVNKKTLWRDLDICSTPSVK